MKKQSRAKQLIKVIAIIIVLLLILSIVALVINTILGLQNAPDFVIETSEDNIIF